MDQISPATVNASMEGIIWFVFALTSVTVVTSHTPLTEDILFTWSIIWTWWVRGYLYSNDVATKDTQNCVVSNLIILSFDITSSVDICKNMKNQY